MVATVQQNNPYIKFRAEKRSAHMRSRAQELKTLPFD